MASPPAHEKQASAAESEALWAHSVKATGAAAALARAHSVRGLISLLAASSDAGVPHHVCSGAQLAHGNAVDAAAQLADGRTVEKVLTGMSRRASLPPGLEEKGSTASAA